MCNHNISIFVVVFALNMVAFGTNMVSKSYPYPKTCGTNISPRPSFHT
jgi:hypothetical protein